MGLNIRSLFELLGRCELRDSGGTSFRNYSMLATAPFAGYETNRADYGNDFGRCIASQSTFGHPAGFINPSATTISRSLWGAFGARFTF
jgi:hypothetical protein